MQARQQKMLSCFNLGLGQILYGQTQPFTFFNYIINQTVGFVHILPERGLKQPSIF